MMSPDHGLEGSPFSYWIESTAATSYPVMPDGVTVDVAIVGGGIAGITTAVLLKKRGFRVAIIEAGLLASQASGHTTAHISAAATPAYYRKIAEKFGEGSARVCARSVIDSIETIDALVREHGIDCDYSRATEYLYGATDQAYNELSEEGRLEARIGLPVRFEDTAPLPFMTHGALRYAGQAEFHPRKYLQGLAATVPGDGCHVFEGTRVRSVIEGDTCTVRTDRGTMRARDVVIATGSPISNLGLLHARMTARRSYVLGVRTEEQLPEHTMFYSSEMPCHYIRSAPSGLLLVGGEDHSTGEAADTTRCYARLERFCRVSFDVRSIEYSWSTQDQYPFDMLPFIGLLPGSRHQYVATGFKGTGMTYGTLSGMIISDLITRGDSPYGSLYAPGRVDLRASGQRLLKRNVHVAKLFATDRLQVPDPGSRLGSGEAGLVMVDGQKAAAYRDGSGTLHAVSPVCKHLGCYVRWNSAERTWDCPCHGSRYDPDGKVINAPAAADLDRVGRVRERR